MVGALLISGLSSLGLALTGYIALCSWVRHALYSLYTAVSRKIVLQTVKSSRDNVESYYG